MNNIVHLAINTFREAVRDRVLYVIFFFGVAMVGVSKAIGWVSVGQQEQVVKHFSLAVISFFGALIAVFVGTAMIYKETDKRTIYTILSKPVHRYEFVLGKFAGLSAVLGLVVALMGGLVCAFVAGGIGGTVDLIFVQAILMIYLELVVVTSVAIMFSTVASPILSAIFTFSAYLVGQVTPSLLQIVAFRPVEEESRTAVDGLALFLSDSHGWLAPLSKVLYWMLPNLTHFSLRNRVVYGPALQDGELGYGLLYALFYSAAMMAVAVMCFQRRRF